MSTDTATTAKATNEPAYAPLQGKWAPNKWAFHVWNNYYDLHDDECQPEFPSTFSAIKQHATDIIDEALQGYPDDALLPNVDLLASRVAELLHARIHDTD
tara:strand:- start:25 stop:324 length:300 start_codon:yes stop_codon:yes gene_type:complete